jgi:ATP-binding cassette, subfamily C, bacterial
MKKYPCVLQHNEEDCGAACLATIARHYGRIFTINHIRQAVGTGQLGTTLLGLVRGAESLEFVARAAKADAAILQRLSALPLPAILHWQGNHYVVLYGQQRGKYVIADPAHGLRYLTPAELKKCWDGGGILLLEPEPELFYQQANDPQPGWSRFWKPVLRHRSTLVEAVLINLMIGSLGISLPFVIQILTDDVLVRGDNILLVRIAIAVIIMQILNAGLGLCQSTLIAHFAQRIQLDLMLTFGRRLLRLPLTYFETHRSGEIASRLRDIDEVNQLISQVVISFPSQFFIAVISFAVMLIYSVKLTLVAIAIGLVMISTTVLMLSGLRRKIQKLIVLEADNQAVLVETFKGALTTKALGATPTLWSELQERFGRLARLGLQTVKISIINRSFSSLVENLGFIILLWVGSTFVISREMTTGQLLAFNSMYASFVAFATFVIQFLSQYIRTKTAIQRLSEVIDTEPETGNHLQGATVTLPTNSALDLRGVGFHYPGRAELLKDISVQIPGGEVVALNGDSGCGKSTLAKLLARLYFPQTGQIRVAGYNVQDLELEELRQQIVLVPQDAHFWSRSILENLRLAKPQASFAEVVEVCQLTGADDFINQLPQTYHTVLGEFGANLSGGQRQRLAIARALLMHPPILILDESTANLDMHSEALLLDALLAKRQGSTTILISHRHQVVDRANWIVELDRGRVAFTGPREKWRTKAGRDALLRSELTYLSLSTVYGNKSYGIVGDRK